MQKFVQENPYNVGLDSAILMNPQVWVASGHVTTFNDPLIDCKSCKMRHRADKLIEDATGEIATAGPTSRCTTTSRSTALTCPECGSRYIRYFGSGTQRVEEELEQMFPAARCCRMDLDTTSRKNAHETMLRRFAKGTNMISCWHADGGQGLDFEKVTLVGVLAADLSLYVDHYRARSAPSAC